jgi:hypothetical protein
MPPADMGLGIHSRSVRDRLRDADRPGLRSEGRGEFMKLLFRICAVVFVIGVLRVIKANYEERNI